MNNTLAIISQVSYTARILQFYPPGMLTQGFSPIWEASDTIISSTFSELTTPGNQNCLLAPQLPTSFHSSTPSHP
jgi:hypothetical protein